jgi:hypothetical protein
MVSRSSVHKDTFFTQSTFNIFLLVAGCSGHFSIFCRVHTTSELGKTTPFQKALSTFGSFRIIHTPVEKKKFGMDMMYFQVFQFYTYGKISNETTQTCTLQDITQQSHLLQPYPKQEVAQQTLF